MGDTRRMFVAVELPSVTLLDIEAVVAPLREKEPEIAWSNAADRHITLKFLGEVPAEGVDVLVQMLDAVARAHRPFSIHLSRIGAFPNFRRARVLWLGVEPESRLELLQHDLELGAEAIGFEIEGRVFRPHVTLARVKTVLEPNRVRGLARATRKAEFSAVVQVAELTLFESTLVPTGPHYRRIHAATVGGR